MKHANAFLKRLDRGMQLHAVKNMAATAVIITGLYFLPTATMLNEHDYDVNRIHNALVVQAENEFDRYQLPLASAINKEQDNQVNMVGVKDEFLTYYAQSAESKQRAKERSEEIKKEQDNFKTAVTIACVLGGAASSAVTVGGYISFRKALKKANEAQFDYDEWADAIKREQELFGEQKEDNEKEL